MKWLVLLLFFPAAAFGLTVTDRGTGANNTSESSTAMNPNGTIPAGSMGVLCIAADNANGTSTNFPSTINDSVGNLWRLRDNTVGGAANSTVEEAVYTSMLSTQLTSGDNVTVTYTPVTPVVAKAWTFTQITPNTAGNIILYRFSSNGSTSNTTTPSITSGNVLIGDVIIGMTGAESADLFTGDSDTLNGSWSTQQHNGAGSGVTGMSITSQWKIETTAQGQQTYNVTLSSAADCRYVAMILTEAPPATRVSQSSGISATTTTVTFTDPIASGSTCVLAWAGDNAGALGNAANLQTPTLTDSKSNTWTLRQDVWYDNGAANAGVEIGIYTCTPTTPLVIGDTVTITYPVTVPSKAWVVFEFTDATAYANSGSGTGATTTTPSVTTGSITNGNYVIGVLGLEGTIIDGVTPDSDTSNGSWSTAVGYSGGLAANAMGVLAQYKKVTATATQTFNVTQTSGDMMIGWVELTAPPAATANTVAFFPFFP